MARRLSRGEIWMLDLPRPDRRRPVLVLSRTGLLELLATVTVAAITTTGHGVPTEVPVGVEEGLKRASWVNLTNLFTVRQAELSPYVGSLSPPKMRAVCAALGISLDCAQLGAP